MTLRGFQLGGFLWVLGVCTMATAAQPAPIPLEIPQAVDSRLEITLYADAPDIVTPIGAAVDKHGRLFVLESHTHQPPANYPGPKRDRIKIFAGVDPNGRAAQTSIFADHILEGLNLAFAPDGTTLYVCSAKTVEALSDHDGDGRCDEARTVLRLETEENYPHNQFLGLTFSPDGWLYVSRGNLAGAHYAWVAADGRRLEGFGDGGDIVRCRPDGTQIERVATGFWNPFDLKFDRHGRLLCIDNDPDSRGPNRLVQIVAGGDYGFKALYGPSGLHPYIAWDGELPGTLPMIAGIGESPAGVIDLSASALPADYRDAIAVTIWAEHNVSLVRPKRAGVSLRGTAEPFIRGGRHFRPVAIVAAPDGTVYLTDWVLKDYPNHGHGRIWRLTAQSGVAKMKPTRATAAATPDSGLERMETLRRAGPANRDAIAAALREEDPFLRHAATMSLARPELVDVARAFFTSQDAALRLGALLALRHADEEGVADVVRAGLKDPDERVRMMSMRWAGEKELRSLLPEVEASASRSNLAPQTFDVWLATVQLLQSEPPPPGAKLRRGFAVKREPSSALLDRVLADSRRPAGLRAYALRQLAGSEAAARHEALLLELARNGETGLRVEALRTLALTEQKPIVRQALRTIATDRAEPPRVRAEAIVALGAVERAALLHFVEDPEPAVRVQAARTLRLNPASNATAAAPAPNAAAEWARLLAAGGDPDAGERVFFALSSTCAQCHRVNGRGGTIGPDLSLIARTVDRERLIRSIVAPSEEISPEYQGWELTTTTGEVLTGRQGHWRTGGAASLLMLDGREKRVSANQVASFQAMQQSLMPEGLAALFSVEEFRDLIAYLISLK